MAKGSGNIRVKAKPSSSAHNFPIVGIGASAGGLDAFKQLIEAIPVDSQMAYVVVQHLNPAHASQLAAILSRVTNIPIQEITDEVKILPNHIYVMPAGKILTSVDGVLKLTPRNSVKTNLVIDIFFTSIAVVWESMAVGVVLSGTGGDGTVGLRMIKKHGGITIAQDESAAYGDMPQSAVNADVADFLLPAEKIPAQLIKINNTYKSAHAIGEEEPLPKNDEIVFGQILQVVYQLSGVDFKHYKQGTVRRRIGRRMALHQRGNLEDYLTFLRGDKAEQDKLFQDMLISVTSFFRDPKTFGTLTEKVFPALLQDKLPEEDIRFWIAGCATGEEAYSMAICLHEYLAKNNLSAKKIQLFGSDISEIAIDKAREGIYSKAEVQSISEERLNLYFTKTGGSYRVNKFIRDWCVFANHNFLKDPPFSKMDLISCRNALIYMDPFLQKNALTTFHYALKESGTLLLGKSENSSAASDLFASFDKQHNIFSRKAIAGSFMQVATGRGEETLTTQNTAAKDEASKTDFRTSANAILLSKSPAAVVINQEMDILHIHGNMEPFLKHSADKPSLNLFDMAREGLPYELRNALHKVKTSKESVSKENISVNANSKQILVTIEIIPLTDSVEPHYLILFTKVHLPAKEEIMDFSSGRSGATLQRIEQLENELSNNREDMRSITEEMEAANGELQSSNENLQRGNKEIQRLNEELETSKEELQSSNEELISLNEELIDKQKHFNTAREYSEAIVSTIKEPLLVLDKNLRIKSANATFYKKFNLAESETAGRQFFELQNHKWDIPELRTLLENFFIQSSEIADFEMILDKSILILNAREFITGKNSEQLMLLAMQDVTDTKLAKKLKVSEEKLNDFFMHAPAMFAILKGPEYVFEFSNAAYVELIGGRNPLGKKVHEVMPEVQGQGFIELLDIVYGTGETFIGNETQVTFVTDGKEKQVFLNFSYQANKNSEGEIDGILVFAYDVTEQVNARKTIEENERIIQKMASHLKLATDSANVGIWLLDMQTQKLEWNALHKNMWGFDAHRTDLVYKDWHKLILPGDKKRIFEKVEEARVNRTAYDVAYRITRADDETVRHIHSVGKYYYNDKGEAETLTGISIDITEQKEAELKLKASEEKYRGVFETMDQAFSIIEIIFDSDNKPVDCVYIETNPMFEIQTGLKNVTGKTAKELIPNIEEHWFQIYGKVALTGEPNRFIEGSEALGRWFEVDTFRLGDQGSKKVAILFTDITERKQIEEKIKLSEAQLRTFADSIQNLAWIANGDGYIYWYNQQWYNFTGTTHEEMEAWGWERVHHPDHIGEVSAFVADAWKKGEAWEQTFPLRRNDGEYHWFLTRAYPVKDANGNIEKWIGTNTDITEQKTFTEELEKKVRERTEELSLKNLTYEAAEKIAKFGSYKWNFITGSLEYSDNMFKLLDCEPNEFIPSFEKFLSFIHPDDMHQVIKNRKETMETGVLVETPYRIISKTGKIKHLRSIGNFSGDDHNRVLIGTVQDISKDIEAAEELRTKNVELELTNAELTSFSYVASHDLQEPLRKIQAFSKLILEAENFGESTQNYFDRVISAAERMQKLIVSLLEFSRTSETEFLFEPCDLTAIVEESILILQLNINEKQATVEYENLPTINASQIQISQVFTNLIDNAIKYSRPEVKPHIKINASVVDGNKIDNPLANNQKEYHRITIADNGIGFKKEYKNKIFELFQRLHGKNEYSGTGIGLAIVKKIVTKHKGFIVAEGKNGIGSTFTIYIPTS